MRTILLAAVTAVLVVLCAIPQAQAQPTTVDEAYAPYARLIGLWETNGGQIVQRFSWGPGRSYILYSTTTRGADGADHVHFEGIMRYNAQSRRLDFLIALEPGSLGQERGTVYAEPDGTIVREVELIGSNGVSSHFRQTFRLSSADAGETSLMRDNGQGGWTPNFPGSDHLAMRRVG
jgi:hypothetical protein